MKTCVVRRRFYSNEISNATVDVDLEPNFGIPKAAMIFYVETAATTDQFDTTSAYRNLGVGVIGPKIPSGTLGYECAHIVIRDNQDNSDSRRQSISELLRASDTAGGIYYRCTSGALNDSKIRFTFAASTPQTNVHLDTLIFAIGGDDVSVAVGATALNVNGGAAGSFVTTGGLSFQPDCIISAGVYQPIAAGVNGNAPFTCGAATRLPFKERFTGYFYQDNVDDNVQAARTGTNAFLGHFSAAGTLVSTNLHQFNADGWVTRTFSTATSLASYVFMAFKSQSPSDVALVDIVTQTATGLFSTGLGISGFVPQTIIGSMTAVTAQNTTQSASPEADALYFFAGMGQSFSKHYLGNGTATYSTGSATVTGSGSTFFKFAPGFKLFTLNGLEIGTISSVASNTSLTLAANALQTGTGVGYCYGTHMQGSILLGDDDANETTNNNSKTYSKASSHLINLTLSTTPSDLHVADLINFNTRPGFDVNTTTASASNRYGWCLAFKSETANRRRGRIS
jgi:hypothetical protein